MPFLPQRLGRFEGVAGLPVIVVASHALVYVFNLFNPGLTDLLVLQPELFKGGEWWRGITFLFVPPPMGFFGAPAAPPQDIFLLAFWLWVTYFFASALEQAWGTFRFTLYYFTGALLTMAAAFTPWAGFIVPNTYLSLSLFLAFAALFPDVRLWLFFILPIRVRYLGYFTWAGVILNLIGGGASTRALIAAGLANYFLLIGPEWWSRRRPSH
jgi:hypothetical protein